MTPEEKEAKRAKKLAEKLDLDYQQFIRKLFQEKHGIYFTVEAFNRERGELTLMSKNYDYVNDKDITFDFLQELSELFGTKKINLRPESGNDGYCESCSSPWSAQAIYLEGVTKWPE